MEEQEEEDKVIWSGPAAWRETRDRNLRTAERDASIWSQPCGCGSGLIAANCRCRVRAIEEGNRGEKT